MIFTNKSITVHCFTSWLVSLMISGQNDHRKPLLNYVKSLSRSKFTIHAIEMTSFTVHQRSEFLANSSQYTRIDII